MKHLLILIALGTLLFAKIPPLSFIALEKGRWHIVACQDKSTCRTIETEQEPRTYDYDFTTGNLVYIASDKNVHLVIDNNESILLKSDKNAYTEPSFIEGGRQIMLVELINRNSKKTKLVSIDLKHKKIKTLHAQYSTALEPYINNHKDLYYANVSCVEGCNKIIQEIWHKNLITDEANQLTLLNVLSHQPRANKDNSKIYFSSIKSGNYHIWEHDFQTHLSKQLTFGNSTDGFPSPYGQDFFFLRRTGNLTKIMHYTPENNVTDVMLPIPYTKIRNLKVKQ